MAAPTNVEEFAFCKLCKLNHADLKSHSYSKRHQESVKTLLKRFLAKVEQAKAVVSSPEIQEQYHEQGVNVWCYFCEMEVRKHRAADGITVVCAGLLAHLNSEHHLKKSKAFWWNNKIDNNILNRYVVKNSDYESFQVNIIKSKEEYKRKRELQLKHEVDHILEVESQRKELLQSCRYASEPVANRIDQDQPSTSTAAHQISGEKPNIFSGMRPPWLDDEVSSSSTKPSIHPNIDDFNRHLKLTKKKRLPAERVGANFDHEGAKPDDWLPSFGRVWNNGRRLATKKQFDAEPRQLTKRHCARNWEDDPAFAPSAAAKPPPNLNKYIL